MSKILTQEEIDSLLSNVAEGQDVDAIEEAKERSTHLYDFKHPDRISKDFSDFDQVFSKHLYAHIVLLLLLREQKIVLR